MIAAVAAVVAGGAFAACDYDPKAPGPDTWAYTWKFTGKTTEGRLTSGTKGTKGNGCGMGTNGSAGGAVRVPASLKIQGYTAYCDVACLTGKDNSFEVNLIECQEVFWQTKPEKASLAGGVEFEVANIIGKKAKQFEVMGVAKFVGYLDEKYALDNGKMTKGNSNHEIKYDLVFAGLGKYDTKNGRPSSASGNFAGKLKYPWYVKPGDCQYGGIWDCDLVTLIGDEDPVASVAFGKWNFKFNKKAAKKLHNNQASNIYGAAKVPKWVVYANKDEATCGK